MASGPKISERVQSGTWRCLTPRQLESEGRDKPRGARALLQAICSVSCLVLKLQPGLAGVGTGDGGLEGALGPEKVCCL